MNAKPLVVVSLDGLATSALGCYGSSWNTTPAIDRLASQGTLWDRMIASSADPLAVLESWLLPDGDADWLHAWSAGGTLELLTDDPRVSVAGLGDRFDRVHLVDADAATTATAAGDELSGGGAEIELAETQFARLVAAALDRHRQPEPWQVLWLHGCSLTHNWDAPRSLFPIDDAEVEQEPVEFELETDYLDEHEEEQKIPPIFHQQAPPCVQIDEGTHPDLVTSWMRTYGCQVRCVDLVISLLQETLADVDPIFVLLSTSGYSLGQNGWIAHQQGPLRSCHLRLPAILASGPPIRSPRVTSSDQIPSLLIQLAQTPQPTPLPPDQWIRDDGEYEPSVVTRTSDRSRVAVSTSRWFFARNTDDAGGSPSESLFLKPDDVEDANDIGRRQHETKQMMREIAGEFSGETT